jgi:phage shock protein PspC (stress-responsive transcriptional regulator)
MISGVCGGIGEYFNVDPTLIRLLFVLLAIVGGGSGLVAYIVLAIIVPEKPLSHDEPSLAVAEPPETVEVEEVEADQEE